MLKVTVVILYEFLDPLERLYRRGSYFDRRMQDFLINVKSPVSTAVKYFEMTANCALLGALELAAKTELPLAMTKTNNNNTDKAFSCTLTTPLV